MDFEDLVPKGNKPKAPAIKSGFVDFDDLIPDQYSTIPTQGMTAEEIPLSKNYEALPLEYQLDQAWAPTQEQFAKSLEKHGFKIIPEMSSGPVVQAPDGKKYALSQSDALITNYPEIGATLLGAILTGGGSLPAMASGSGVRGFAGMLARLLGRGAMEGGANAGLETLRQAEGIRRGAGQSLDVDNIAGAGIAGAASPLISKSVMGAGNAAKWAQEKMSGIPESLAKKVRANPSYAKGLTPEGISRTESLQEKAIAEEAAQIQALQDDFMEYLRQSGKTMEEAAESMGKAVRNSQAHTSADALGQESLKVLEDIPRAIGGKDPLQPYKEELTKDLMSRQKPIVALTDNGKQIPLVDSKGNPLLKEEPEEAIGLDRIHATRKYMDDLVNWSAKEGDGATGEAAKRIGGVLRGHEAALSPIDAALERERLASIFDTRRNFPSIKSAIDAGDEKALSDFLFKKRPEAVDAGLKQWQDVASDYGYGDIPGRYSAIRKRMQALEEMEDTFKQGLRELKTESKHTGLFPQGNTAAQLAPLAAGALGFGAGGPAGLATGIAATSPRTSIAINQLLHYLDRAGAKRGVGRTTNTLREWALQEALEGKEK